MSRNLVPPVAVLAWLQANHPQLHSELDRSWVWLTTKLGPGDEVIIESLKAFGFREAKRGHPLKSGKVGTWSHCGTKPIPFKRRQWQKGQQREGFRSLDAEIDAILQAS